MIVVPFPALEIFKKKIINNMKLKKKSFPVDF
jgi:hypothetical protein